MEGYEPTRQIVAVARPDLFAVYSTGDFEDEPIRLPVVAFDERGRALVATREGRLAVASEVRPLDEGAAHDFVRVTTR